MTTEDVREFNLADKWIRRVQILVTAALIVTFWFATVFGSAFLDIGGIGEPFALLRMGFITLAIPIAGIWLGSSLRKARLRITPHAIAISENGICWRELPFANGILAYVTSNALGHVQRIDLSDPTTGKSLTIRGFDSMEEILSILVVSGTTMMPSERVRSENQRVFSRSITITIIIITVALIVAGICWYAVNLTSGLLVLFVVTHGWLIHHFWRNRDMGGRFDAFLATVYVICFVSFAIAMMIWLDSAGYALP